MIKMGLNFLGLLLALFVNNACDNSGLVKTGSESAVLSPAADSTSLVLPKGFKATVFYQNLGRARHIAVAPNGDVYVKLEKLKDGNGIYRITDANKDGVAENATGFGNYIGTGMAIKNGYLYASSDDAVYRYKMEQWSGCNKRSRNHCKELMEPQAACGKSHYPG